jgi:hypothetical protein
MPVETLLAEISGKDEFPKTLDAADDDVAVGQKDAVEMLHLRLGGDVLDERIDNARQPIVEFACVSWKSPVKCAPYAPDSWRVMLVENVKGMRRESTRSRWYRRTDIAEAGRA